MPPPSPPHSRPNPTRHCVKRERGSNYIEYTMKGAVYVTPSTKVIPSLSFNYVSTYYLYQCAHSTQLGQVFFFPSK